jgi:anti-anti-sigma factor
MSVSTTADGLLLRIAGELDDSTVGAVGAALTTGAATSVTAVDVDLGEVTFLSLRALGVLVTAHDDLAARGGRLVISSCSPVVQRLIGLADAVGMLPVGLWLAAPACRAGIG